MVGMRWTFDGTLAEYHGWAGTTNLGPPVPKMVERVKKMLAEGKDVRIFTARVWPLRTTEQDLTVNAKRVNEAVAAYMAIQVWCETHIGKALPITCIKDYGMISLVDDRLQQCYPNTGVLLEDEVRRLKIGIKQAIERGRVTYNTDEDASAVVYMLDDLLGGA